MWPLSGQGGLLLATLPVAAALGLAAIGQFEALVLAVLLGRSTLEYAATVAGAGSQLTALVAAGFTIVALVWLAAQQGDIGGTLRIAPERSGGAAPRTQLSPFARAALLFAATGIVGVVVSPDPALSLGILARLFSFAVVVVAVERLLLTHPAAIRRVLIAVFASSLLPILVTVYQVASGNGLQLIDGFLRAPGTFVHPNEFAIYLGFLMIMEAALALALRGRPQWLLGGLFVLTGACLLQTYARGAWIAVAAGLFVVGLLHSRTTVVLLGIAGLLAIVLLPSVRGRFADLVQPQPDRTEWGAPPNSLAWRLSHWSESIALADHSPATGAGLGMVNADSQFEAHNDYVRAYAETGIIGLAAYLWMMLGLARNVARSIRFTKARTAGRALAAGFAGCTVAFVAISLTDNVITSLADVWYFAALAATATAAAAHVHSGIDSGIHLGRSHADPARQ
jgi:O-antigen ligase